MVGADETGDPLRDAIERAVLATAAGDPYREHRREAALVRAVQACLDEDREVRWTQREVRAHEDGWTRRPGGVDLVVDVDGRRAGLEFKLDHIDQCLWDVLKLCGEPFDVRGLVVEASDRVWRDALRPGGELFALGHGRVTWHTSELITRWPVAWQNLMIGGRGIRPTQCVPSFNGVGVVDAQMDAYPSHHLRLCWIEPANTFARLTFDATGWPSGYGPAPADFERLILAVDENRRSEGGPPLPWPPDDNSSLTFADLPARLPRGRAHEAMRQAWPRILDEDRPRVRGELVRRGWTPDELELCGIVPAN